eukprot:10580466-Alexandrium_andersonii.AAC.1
MHAELHEASPESSVHGRPVVTVTRATWIHRRTRTQSSGVLATGHCAECVCVCPFPPLTCPRHARTPGWDGGQTMFNDRYSPEMPDASGQCSEAPLALESAPETLPWKESSEGAF